MYNLAMLHGSSNGLGIDLTPDIVDRNARKLKRKTGNAYKKAKKVVTKTVDDGLDKVGEFADVIYKYSGAEKIVEFSQNTWDDALKLLDDYIWEPIKKASLNFIKDKLVKKYGDELIKVPMATVVGYGTTISAQLITFLNVTFPGYGTLISAGVPPLVTALTYAVVEEIKDQALNAGKRTLKKAEEYFDDVLNDEIEHANLILSGISPEEKYDMATKVEAQKAAAIEYYNYSQARPGIPAPSKITVQTIEVEERGYGGAPTGRKVQKDQTVLTYFSTGKTYTTPYTPSVWMEKFKANNPNSTAYLQPNGIVVSIAPASATPAFAKTKAIETQKAQSIEYYNYSQARPGIPAPSKITVQTIEVEERGYGGAPTGRKVQKDQTVLTYFSTGKTYTTPFTPSAWMEKFKANNPNSTAYLQPNGIVVSIAPASATPAQYASPGSGGGGGGGGGGGSYSTQTPAAIGPAKSNTGLVLALAAAAALLLT